METNRHADAPCTDIAVSRWTQDACQTFGLTQKQSLHLLDVFRRYQLVTLDTQSGRYLLKHGTFWTPNVVRSALEQ